MLITNLLKSIFPSMNSKESEKTLSAIDSAEKIAYLLMIINLFKRATFPTTPTVGWPTTTCYVQPPGPQPPGPTCYLVSSANTGINLTSEQIKARENLTSFYKDFIDKL